MKKIQNLIKRRKKVMVALSGGVDSHLLLALAQKTIPGNVIAITVASPFVSPDEIVQARKIARTLKVQHIVTRVGILQNRKLQLNPRDRCYRCKRLIFMHLLKIAKKHHATVIEASNFTDTSDFRPGLKALKELNVLSPFILSRLTKAEIRLMAKRFRLITWNKPSNACLATRIPYGNKITIKALQRIDRAETYLRRMGFSPIRVRDHSGIARIETAKEHFSRLIRDKKKIIRYIKTLGYSFVTMDLEGYRSGNLN